MKKNNKKKKHDDNLIKIKKINNNYFLFEKFKNEKNETIKNFIIFDN